MLSDAVKYSPSGGEVVVTLRRERDATGAWAVVVVRDQGIGIPEAELDGVFERFRRGSNVPAPVGSRGIGLASVRQIVCGHGSTVTVESREGEGTAVTGCLPLEPPPAPASSVADGVR